jgi:UDP-N-acetylglucosamine transferase subunit ALG13
VIFLTIGTHEPFDRLVKAVDEWCLTTGNREVFGQITDKGVYRPTCFEWVGRIEPETFEKKCAQADFLIAHAGMGSIITAMTLAKPIVVLPRRGHLSETRNDHQFATARKLQGKPGIFVAMSEAELPAVLDELVACRGAVHTRTIGPFAEERLIDTLRNFIG